MQTSPTTTTSSRSNDNLTAVAAQPVSVSPVVATQLPDECPPSVDAEVFAALPFDVQQELRAQWRHANRVANGQAIVGVGGSPVGASAAAAAVAVAVNGGGSGAGGAGNKTKTNTLHRYFIANSQ